MKITNKDIFDTFRENVKKRRRELGITQDELAKRTGYANKHAVSKIEVGKLDMSITKLPDFASALDCSVAYLIGIDKEQRINRNLNSELGYKDVELLTKFSKLSDENKNIISALIDALNK